MLGTNPKRKPETGDGSALKVVEIFPTLQGEGPHTGVPAVFVRLGGCNLACAFCDTEFETFHEMPLADIIADISAKSETSGTQVRHLVVITGGEPLRQPIAPLCDALLNAGFAVQIETNGSIYRELPKAVDVVCSPKAVDGKYYPLRPDMLARVNALKFLVDAQTAPYDSVPDVGQTTRMMDLPIFLQPMDVGDAARNQENMAHAVALCGVHGYRLSLQTHKILGIA